MQEKSEDIALTQAAIASHSPSSPKVQAVDPEALLAELLALDGQVSKEIATGFSTLVPVFNVFELLRGLWSTATIYN